MRKIQGIIQKKVIKPWVKNDWSTIMNKLLVILAEPISGWVKKGEIIDRYLNPGNTFDHVTIFLLNNDCPDQLSLKRMVGDASFDVYNFSAGIKIFALTLGWRPTLLGFWMRKIVNKAKEINPQVVRCYSAHLNIEAARRIKLRLDIPYFVSLHINPNSDLNSKGSVKQKLGRKAISRVELIGLREAELVMPVYSSILPFLKSKTIRKSEIFYNMTNERHLKVKEDYALSFPIKILNVGRQFVDKNPSNIIKAIAQIPDVHLTLIGDGPLHDQLCALVSSLDIEHRVTIIRATSNDDVCKRLAQADIFVIQSTFNEFPKTVLEALLTGTPTIVNSDLGKLVAEFSEDRVQYAEDSPSGYVRAIKGLLHDDLRREEIGREGHRYASKSFASKDTELKFANLYRHYL